MVDSTFNPLTCVEIDTAATQVGCGFALRILVLLLPVVGSGPFTTETCFTTRGCAKMVSIFQVKATKDRPWVDQAELIGEVPMGVKKQASTGTVKCIVDGLVQVQNESAE
jgi:hypothetical protein